MDLRFSTLARVAIIWGLMIPSLFVFGVMWRAKQQVRESMDHPEFQPRELVCPETARADYDSAKPARFYARPRLPLNSPFVQQPLLRPRMWPQETPSEPEPIGYPLYVEQDDQTPVVEFGGKKVIAEYWTPLPYREPFREDEIIRRWQTRDGTVFKIVPKGQLPN